MFPLSEVPLYRCRRLTRGSLGSGDVIISVEGGSVGYGFLIISAGEEALSIYPRGQADAILPEKRD